MSTVKYKINNSNEWTTLTNVLSVQNIPNLHLGDTITLEAEVDENRIFVEWINSLTNKHLSYDTTFTFTISDDSPGNIAFVTEAEAPSDIQLTIDAGNELAENISVTVTDAATSEDLITDQTLVASTSCECLHEYTITVHLSEYKYVIYKWYNSLWVEVYSSLSGEETTLTITTDSIDIQYKIFAFEQEATSYKITCGLYNTQGQNVLYDSDYNGDYYGVIQLKTPGQTDSNIVLVGYNKLTGQTVNEYDAEPDSLYNVSLLCYALSGLVNPDNSGFAGDWRYRIGYWKVNGEIVGHSSSINISVDKDMHIECFLISNLYNVYVDYRKHDINNNYQNSFTYYNINNAWSSQIYDINPDHAIDNIVSDHLVSYDDLYWTLQGGRYEGLQYCHPVAYAPAGYEFDKIEWWYEDDENNIHTKTRNEYTSDYSIPPLHNNDGTYDTETKIFARVYFTETLTNTLHIKIHKYEIDNQEVIPGSIILNEEDFESAIGYVGMTYTDDELILTMQYGSTVPNIEFQPNTIEGCNILLDRSINLDLTQGGSEAQGGGNAFIYSTGGNVRDEVNYLQPYIHRMIMDKDYNVDIVFSVIKNNVLYVVPRPISQSPSITIIDSTLTSIDGLYYTPGCNPDLLNHDEWLPSQYPIEFGIIVSKLPQTSFDDNFVYDINDNTSQKKWAYKAKIGEANEVIALIPFTISGLEPNNVYFITPYAKNPVSVKLGTELVCFTKINYSSGTVLPGLFEVNVPITNIAKQSNYQDIMTNIPESKLFTDNTGRIPRYIRFTSGNLKCRINKSKIQAYEMAISSNQYDVCEFNEDAYSLNDQQSNEGDWFDLFGWGTSGMVKRTSNNDYTYLDLEFDPITLPWLTQNKPICSRTVNGQSWDNEDYTEFSDEINAYNLHVGNKQIYKQSSPDDLTEFISKLYSNNINANKSDKYGYGYGGYMTKTPNSGDVNVQYGGTMIGFFPWDKFYNTNKKTRHQKYLDWGIYNFNAGYRTPWGGEFQSILDNHVHFECKVILTDNSELYGMMIIPKNYTEQITGFTPNVYPITYTTGQSPEFTSSVVNTLTRYGVVFMPYVGIRYGKILYQYFNADHIPLGSYWSSSVKTSTFSLSTSFGLLNAVDLFQNDKGVTLVQNDALNNTLDINICNRALGKPVRLIQDYIPLEQWGQTPLSINNTYGMGKIGVTTFNESQYTKIIVNCYELTKAHSQGATFLHPCGTDLYPLFLKGNVDAISYNYKRNQEEWYDITTLLRPSSVMAYQLKTMNSTPDKDGNIYSSLINVRDVFYVPKNKTIRLLFEEGGTYSPVVVRLQAKVSWHPWPYGSLFDDTTNPEHVLNFNRDGVWRPDNLLDSDDITSDSTYDVMSNKTTCYMCGLPLQTGKQYALNTSTVPGPYDFISSWNPAITMTNFSIHENYWYNLLTESYESQSYLNSAYYPIHNYASYWTRISSYPYNHEYGTVIGFLTCKDLWCVKSSYTDDNIKYNEFNVGNNDVVTITIFAEKKLRI